MQSEVHVNDVRLLISHSLLKAVNVLDALLAVLVRTDFTFIGSSRYRRRGVGPFAARMFQQLIETMMHRCDPVHIVLR